MILQYKGFNNNWSYEEAETITVATVEVTRAKIEANESEEELCLIKDISEKIDQEIRESTNCANITYITKKPIYELGYVKVAMLSDKNKDCAYVFDMNTEVYLLNNSGKTVRKV